MRSTMPYSIDDKELLEELGVECGSFMPLDHMYLEVDFCDFEPEELEVLEHTCLILGQGGSTHSVWTLS